MTFEKNVECDADNSAEDYNKPIKRVISAADNVDVPK